MYFSSWFGMPWFDVGRRGILNIEFSREHRRVLMSQFANAANECAQSDQPERLVTPMAAKEVVVSRVVPGTEDRTVKLIRAPDHSIWVERDAAWSGFHEAPADRFAWLGGIPNPERPGAPPAGPHKDALDLEKAPVNAVMAAAKGGVKLTREEKLAARETWADLWIELSGHLDPEVAQHCARFNYTSPLYQLLLSRPDLVDHLNVLPGIGPFYSQEVARSIPESGWDLKQIAAHVVSSGKPEGISVSPGFIAWGEANTWDPSRTPTLPRRPAARQAAMRRIALGAFSLGDDLDPNGIHKLESDDEWLLVNQALSSESTRSFVPKILTQPAASVKRVGDYFPPGLRVIELMDGTSVRLDRRGKVSRVLEVVREYTLDNPEKAENVDSFSGLVKRTRKWDQKTRAKEAGQHDRRVSVEAQLWSDQHPGSRALAEQRHLMRRYGVTREKTLPAGIEIGEDFPNLPPENLRVVEGQRRVMVLLETPLDLIIEGKRAKHCVGANRYITGCHEGRSYIFTVRGTNQLGDPSRSDFMSARPLATVKVSSSSLRKEQAYGYDDEPLTGELASWVNAAVERFRKDLLAERRKPSPDPITP